jgi:hypothetical protein
MIEQLQKKKLTDARLAITGKTSSNERWEDWFTSGDVIIIKTPRSPALTGDTRSEQVSTKFGIERRCWCQTFSGHATPRVLPGAGGRLTGISNL